MTSGINNPVASHCFCSQWPLKVWSQLLTRSNRERPKNSKGAHLSLLRQRQNMTQLTKVKQNTHEHKDKSCKPKKHKDKLKTQLSCTNFLLLTVSAEEVACWQYKTVLIIFPLNVQTSTKLQILSNGGEGRNIQWLSHVPSGHCGLEPIGKRHSIYIRTVAGVSYCCFTRLEQSATSRHISTISTDFQEKAVVFRSTLFSAQQPLGLIPYLLTN